MKNNTSSHLSSQSTEELQQALEQKKEHLEKELGGFATKDPNVKGDWDSKFPRTPQGNLEEAADEVEEYSTRVHVEFALENQLRDVTHALEKIKEGKYGICESCQNPISVDRLQVSPEAKVCQQCNK